MLVSRRTHHSSNDSGSALVSVMIVMLVLTLLAVTLASVVTTTSRSVTTSRGLTQARQAADAGLSAALAGFKTTTDCSRANLTTVTAPSYRVVCSVAGDQVTLVSTGHGERDATATVKAVYEFEIIVVEDEVDHMTFFGEATFTKETDSIDPSGGLLTISVADGDFTCQNTIEATVKVAGRFRGNGSCVIKGNVWAGGLVTTGNPDVIEGNAISAATSGTNTWLGTINGDFTTGTNVELAWVSSRGIRGNLRSAGDVTLHDAKVGGNLTAPAGKMVTASWMTVNLPAGSHAQVGGSVIRPGSVSAPTAPTFPTWREYNYAPADWTGYAKVTLAASDCSSYNSWPNQGWKNLADLTAPTVIDARACSGGLSSNAGGTPSPAIRANLVIIASSFDLTALTVTKHASAPADTKMWLIVPDTIDNDAPLSACSSGTILINGTTVKVPTLLYTPGCVKVAGGGTFTGSMYSGGFDYGGAIDMYGVKVGFPGGAAGGGGGPAGLNLTRLSQRSCRTEDCSDV